MTTLINQKHFSKLVIAVSVVMAALTYGCNGPSTKEVKTDSLTTTVPATDNMSKMSSDSMMKMKTDSGKTDTSGKGGQTPPPRN